MVFLNEMSFQQRKRLKRKLQLSESKINNIYGNRDLPWDKLNYCQFSAKKEKQEKESLGLG